MTRSLLLVVVATAVSAGCGGQTDAPQLAHPSPQPSPEQADKPKKLQAPVLDRSNIPTTTCKDHIAISGTAKPSVTVFALGGAATAGISSDAHPQTGSFCLPVALKKGQLNKFEIRAQDPKLGVSTSVTVRITRKICDEKKDDTTSSAPAKAKPKNVALGAKVRSKDSPKSGSGNNAVDGSTSTVVTYSGGWFDHAYNGWVALDLDKLYRISKIVVRWRDASGSGKHYGKDYMVLASHASSASEPYFNNGWTEVKRISSGDGGTDTIDLKSKMPFVQHVALFLYGDAAFNWSETFAIAEIEVWSAPDDSPSTPPIKSNVCTGS